MDCLFNKYIPQSDSNKIILRPIGQTFANGLASSYDEEIPPELLDYIDENTYKKCIIDLNETLLNYWPCFCARCIGYLFCLCSLGISLLMPNICIKDAEENFLRRLEYYNQEYFKNKGFHMKLVKKCSTSWLEIEIFRSAQKPLTKDKDDTSIEI